MKIGTLQPHGVMLEDKHAWVGEMSCARDASPRGIWWGTSRI